MTSDEIREKYLKFFEAKGHQRIEPAPLVLENDPTTLFTSAGMQPLIPYLKGEPHPKGKRLVDIQPSLRLQDIEEVGDASHTTFFEMLGNWSLGDYFKETQIPQLFTFLVTKSGLEIDPEHLYATIFKGDPKNNIPRDTESENILREEYLHMLPQIEVTVKEDPGLSEMKTTDRIFYYDARKNWWSRSGTPEEMPVGEIGGPDCEIFYQFTGVKHNSKYGKYCHPNCGCGRFLEIGNSVFIEYERTKEGVKPLRQQNVDFGGGLERIMAAVRQSRDIYEIDVFQPAIREIIGSTGIVVDSEKTYTSDEYPAHPILVEEEDREKTREQSIKAIRIIADHLRAATFLLSEGVFPSNKERGYVLRRLIRRAVLHSRHIGINGNFTARVGKAFIESYKDVYPQLENNSRIIYDELEAEETRFRLTLENGLKEFDKYVTIGEVGRPETQKKILSPRDIFFLYETYGFPYELSKEEGERRGIKIPSRFEFEEEFKKHQEKSRTASAGMFKGGLADTSEQVTRLHTATHLLHAALRKILGEHVAQKGSNITAERLRFDFSHPQKLTAEEIKKVDDLVNAQIKKDLPVSFKTMSLDEAVKEGALHFFGEKYGKEVKVYTIGDFSKEVCGGPHVKHTGELGRVRIIKQEKVGAGVVRIYAVSEKT